MILNRFLRPKEFEAEARAWAKRNAAAISEIRERVRLHNEQFSAQYGDWYKGQVFEVVFKGMVLERSKPGWPDGLASGDSSSVSRFERR